MGKCITTKQTFDGGYVAYTQHRENGQVVTVLKKDGERVDVRVGGYRNEFDTAIEMIKAHEVVNADAESVVEVEVVISEEAEAWNAKHGRQQLKNG